MDEKETKLMKLLIEAKVSCITMEACAKSFAEVNLPLTADHLRSRQKDLLNAIKEYEDVQA